jgi:ADP-ribosylglycohydrolase
MIGGGPFGLEPGEWTDDTSMALCLAESLIGRKEFDPIDQLERYVRWWRHGHLSSTNSCFDIGNTVQDALARFERSRQPYGRFGRSLERWQWFYHAFGPGAAVLRAAPRGGN